MLWLVEKCFFDCLDQPIKQKRHNIAYHDAGTGWSRILVGNHDADPQAYDGYKRRVDDDSPEFPAQTH